MRITLPLPAVKICLLTSLTLLAVSLYQGDELPPPKDLLPQLAQEPTQTPTTRTPFQTTVAGTVYTIKPLYRYDLYGLVVSKHEASDMIDWAHKAWGDTINTADLCVVWGENAMSGIYQSIRFTSGNWTCYFDASDSAVWQKFSGRQVSNNHILTDTAAITRLLKKTRVGDQVHFSGYLADYRHGSGERRSSTTRDDTGNGACETVYLDRFERLKAAPVYWRVVRWLSAMLLLTCLALWFLIPIEEHLRPR